LLAYGVDGCRAGWIVVKLASDGGRDVTIIERIGQLLLLDRAMVFIDMPIGLPDSGYRGCDLAARKLLKNAQSRVFLGLRRPLLGYLGDYPAANAWAKGDGKGLAKQAFAILPKIAEIDAIMTPARQETFRESHPELVFQRLNNGTALPSKHTPAGIAARRNMVAQAGFTDIDAWLGALRGSGAKADYLLDACVLAVAARDAARGDARCVDCAERRDTRGLRMDIWF
jgi:predicted RNase H-like nuclease